MKHEHTGKRKNRLNLEAHTGHDPMIHESHHKANKAVGMGYCGKEAKGHEGASKAPPGEANECEED